MHGVVESTEHHYIGFASWHRTGITRIGEYDLNAVRFQYFVNRNPVSAC